MKDEPIIGALTSRVDRTRDLLGKCHEQTSSIESKLNSIYAMPPMEKKETITKEPTGFGDKLERNEELVDSLLSRLSQISDHLTKTF